MQSSRGKIWIPLHELSKNDRIALTMEMGSWQARIASLASSSQALADPESNASARILERAEYCDDVFSILAYAESRTHLAKKVSEFQKELVGLRKERKNCSSRQRIKIKRKIDSALWHCGMLRSAAVDFCQRCAGMQEKIKNNSSFYTKHLIRIGMPSDSPLLLQAVCGGSPQNRTATMGYGIPVDPNYERAALVSQTRLDFQRMLDAKATKPPAFEKFLRENPKSPIAKAFNKQPDETGRICSEIGNSQNLGQAYDLVSICLEVSTETIRRAWYQNRDTFAEN